MARSAPAPKAWSTPHRIAWNRWIPPAPATRFIGSFACFLGSGYAESEALARANVYAALSTLSVGTQMSFVTAERFQAAWATR